jgi:hypothetical protein
MAVASRVLMATLPQWPKAAYQVARRPVFKVGSILGEPVTRMIGLASSPSRCGWWFSLKTRIPSFYLAARKPNAKQTPTPLEGRRRLLAKVDSLSAG